MPKEKVLLGIDVGSHRMGLAIWRQSSQLTTPLEFLKRKKLDADLKRIAEILKKEAVEAIVVGLPLSLSGNETSSTENARFWAEKLKEVFALPVYFQDEALSTKEAERRMRTGPLKKSKRDRIDSAAACIILEEYVRASD